MKTVTCYRIVEVRNGKPHSLFHGTRGRRELPVGVWIDADKKIVSDGSCPTKYISGFHVLLTEEDAITFFNKMFRIKKNRIVIECDARGLRKKAHSKSDVFLADHIRIPDKYNTVSA